MMGFASALQHNIIEMMRRRSSGRPLFYPVLFPNFLFLLHQFIQCVKSASKRMLWILRRTRASLTLFNGNNNNENRPAHKGYNKLSSKAEEINRQESTQQNKNDLNKPTTEEFLDNNENAAGLAANINNNNNANSIQRSLIVDSSDLDYDEDDDGGGGGFSDDSDYEEALTCNVCDRTFSRPKQLSAHKQKKRHFGCSACDSLFPSLMSLEHHKEEFEHWSDEDEICTDDDDDDDDYTIISEECERLL